MQDPRRLCGGRLEGRVVADGVYRPPYADPYEEGPACIRGPVYTSDGTGGIPDDRRDPSPFLPGMGWQS